MASGVADTAFAAVSYVIHYGVAIADDGDDDASCEEVMM